MKKMLVILLALAMVFSLLAAFPFAAWADEAETTGGTETAVETEKDDYWDGTAKIAWYLDGPEADGAYHIRSLEDLYGLSYIVNAYYSDYESFYDGQNHYYKGCYNGLWYDKETKTVLGFEPSGYDGSDHMFDYAKSGLKNPKPEGETVNGNMVSYTDNNGLYTPKYDYKVSKDPVDGSVYLAGGDKNPFQYETVVLDADLQLNEGNVATLSTLSPADVNVWMPIGGGRDYHSSAFPVFNGTFKGNGHTISGLYFNDDTSSAVGFFGYLSRTGTTVLQDFILKDCYFNGATFVGGVAGRLDGGVNAFNCHVQDSYIYGKDSAGGFVGAVHGGTLMLQQCSLTGIDVDARYTVGAIVGGMNYQSLIAIDCLLEGTVTAHTEPSSEDESKTIGGWDIGVLVGRIAQGSITAQRVISVVEVNQEAENATATISYSATCGLIYGALARKGSAGEEYWQMNSNPTVKKFFYVDLFNTASAEEKPITPATGATAVSITKLQGIAPSVQLIPKAGATEEDFDFSDSATDHIGVWTCDYEGDDLPHLTNMGKATEGAPSSSGNSGSSDGHDLSNWVSAKPATCEAAGIIGHYECSHCGKNLAEDGSTVLDSIVDPIKDHTFKEVAATDTMKAHYRCTVCQKYFDENKNEVKKKDLQIEAKKGCGSVIVGAPLIAVAIFGSALLMKKKEDESK